MQGRLMGHGFHHACQLRFRVSLAEHRHALRGTAHLVKEHAVIHLRAGFSLPHGLLVAEFRVSNPAQRFPRQRHAVPGAPGPAGVTQGGFERVQGFFETAQIVQGPAQKVAGIVLGRVERAGPPQRIFG